MSFQKILSAAALVGCMSLPAFAQDVGSADEAKTLLGRAAAEVAKSGVEGAYKAFSDPKGAFVDRDLYVFCLSPAGTIIAHGGNPALVGKDFSAIKDSDGKLFVAEMLKVAQSSPDGWVDYKWPNPTTKKIEAKSSYVRKIGTDVCGVGIYKR